MYGENVLYAEEFNQFAGNTTLLPFDHHMVIRMVAPRALSFLDNICYAWLSPQSAWGCAVAGGTVYQVHWRVEQL